MLPFDVSSVRGGVGWCVDGGWCGGCRDSVPE